MRSSTKSVSNGNSDNMNNNTIEVDDDRDKRVASADDIIDIACTEETKLHNQPGNCETELTQRTEHVEDKSEKVNVYEQVRA